MGESRTQHWGVSGIFNEITEREDQCRGGGVVGAYAQFPVWGYDGEVRDVRAAQSDDR